MTQTKFENLKPLKMKKIKYFTLVLILTFLSCGPPPPQLIEKPITKEQAKTIISNLAGIEKPKENLYHTYEKTKQELNYYQNNLESKSSTTNTLTISKIEGNYVEGRVSSIANGIISPESQFFGRFNSTHLYAFIFRDNSKWPLIAKYELTQEERVLVYEEYTWKYEGYQGGSFNLKWNPAPKLNVDVVPWQKNNKIINTSTGYVSQTDDYVGEKRSKTSNENQSLTEKIKELQSLLDKKIITKEEFDKLRNKLINN